MIYTPLATLLTSLLTLTLLSCQAQKAQPANYTNADGVLLVSVYSRGAYQYILAIPDAKSATRLYPVNLTEGVKQQALKADPAAPIQVRFSGKLTGKKETLKQITANDAGAAAGQIPQISITAITVKK
ncbi:hypothetical protein [Fibrivirga algicola]|uniref:Uncharacterized protein n=1 Tax=Fibrivirga algicola TaxID=2950420 RepID=A0ABX0QL46_9BACT|nr:hypothetical protein [Fibrivirga algicola]NID12548.1 hypothetical protein [Fibrivirga algicola]